jgi:Photoprotection regulator fluorescence recovery protein
MKRLAFDRALHQELDATIQEAKQMADRIEQADELWELERHLTQRRKEIDLKYEFKYSSILLVLAELVREHRISLDELRGLSEDKLHCVRDHSRHAAA